MKIEILKKLNIELPTELEEFIESGHDNLNDYAHEYADSSESVIYYSKAEELYHAASTKERDLAEAMNEDCGGFPDGCDMAQRFCILAYWIEYSRISEIIKDQAYEATAAVRDYIDDLEAVSYTHLTLPTKA